MSDQHDVPQARGCDIDVELAGDVVELDRGRVASSLCAAARNVERNAVGRPAGLGFQRRNRFVPEPAALRASVQVCPLLAAALRRVRECQPEKYGKQTEDDERRADVEPLERVKRAVDRKHEGRLDQAKDEEEHPDTYGGQSAMSL